MLSSTQITSDCDREKLIAALDHALSSWTTYAPFLTFFRRTLRHSRAVPPAEIPSTMLTMNSRFSVSGLRRSREPIPYTLVFPEDESASEGKLSVLTPMGMALLGARVGQEVRWFSENGPEVARVEELFYQPEAAGHCER